MLSIKQHCEGHTKWLVSRCRLSIEGIKPFNWEARRQLNFEKPYGHSINIYENEKFESLVDLDNICRSKKSQHWPGASRTHQEILAPFPPKPKLVQKTCFVLNLDRRSSMFLVANKELSVYWTRRQLVIGPEGNLLNWEARRQFVKIDDHPPIAWAKIPFS